MNKKKGIYKMKKLIIIIIILFANKNFSQDSLFIYPSAKNIEILVSASVIKNDSNFIYNFEVFSGTNSLQNIFQFFVEVRLGLDSVESPASWRGKISSRWLNILMWSSRDSLYDILPGSSLSGFKYVSGGIPSIKSFYCRGYFEIPSFEEGEAPDASEIESGGILENSVPGYTIGASPLPAPFIPLNFLDTLLNYTQRSFELGWIPNQSTADKYTNYFNTAKTQLQQNNIAGVQNTLQTVLQVVDQDSSGNITSEAYALLRFNTEYLLENLTRLK